MTKLRRGILAVLPIALLAIWAWAGLGDGLAPGEPAAAAVPLRFAWLSDTHGSDRGSADLRASVADINKQASLAFVLVTGDVTEMGLYKNLNRSC